MKNLIVLFLMIFNAHVMAVNVGGESRQGSENQHRPRDVQPNAQGSCPNAWAYAAPTTDFQRGVAGTLVCNTALPQSVCPCKKCEFIKMPYSARIFDNVYKPFGRARSKTDNLAEQWLRENSCRQADRTSKQIIPASNPIVAPKGYARPKMDGGDRQDCDLLASASSTDMAATCTHQLENDISKAGRCSSYFEKRARQGGHGYGAEQSRPRVCEILAASDALTADQLAAFSKGGVMDRSTPSETDVQDCRSLVDNDARGQKYCFNMVTKAIQSAGPCKYYYGALFRQGDTCPKTGPWVNISNRSGQRATP